MRKMFGAAMIVAVTASTFTLAGCGGSPQPSSPPTPQVVGSASTNSTAGWVQKYPQSGDVTSGSDDIQRTVVYYRCDASGMATYADREWAGHQTHVYVVAVVPNSPDCR